MKKRSPSKGIKRSRSRAKSGKVSVTIGRERFAKISKVEGIELTGEMRQRAADLDRRGSSAEERRTTIIQAYRNAPSR